MTAPGHPLRGAPRCPHVIDVGPYVLDALSPEERDALESHLPGCAECRRAVDELAALPGWLDLVPPGLVDTDLDPDLDPRPHPHPEPPPALLADLVRVARREAAGVRRRRTWTGALAVAAVVALGVLLSVGTVRVPWLPGPTAPAPTVEAEAIELAPVVDTPVSATVRLQSVAWGTRIDLTCQYGAGAAGPSTAPGDPGGQVGTPGYGMGDGSSAGDGALAGDGAAGSRYALVVRDAQGRTEEVATWAVVVGAPMRVPASTVIPREQIVEVELRGSDGATLLRADV